MIFVSSTWESSRFNIHVEVNVKELRLYYLVFLESSECSKLLSQLGAVLMERSDMLDVMVWLAVLHQLVVLLNKILMGE